MQGLFRDFSLRSDLWALRTGRRKAEHRLILDPLEPETPVERVGFRPDDVGSNAKGLGASRERPGLGRLDERPPEAVAASRFVHDQPLNEAKGRIRQRRVEANRRPNHDAPARVQDDERFPIIVFREPPEDLLDVIETGRIAELPSKEDDRRGVLRGGGANGQVAAPGR